MDRFKFRFWDKETQTMQKIPMVELRHRISLDKIFADDRVIFMQCTGLKDKNGNLIYEGDIISDDYDNTLVEWSETNCQFLVVEENDGIKTCYTFEQLQSLEIIGNIYENPELIEDFRR